jgi:hypothetical protein
LNGAADALQDGLLAQHVGGGASSRCRDQVEDAGALPFDRNSPRARQIGKQLEEIIVGPRANRTTHDASVCSIAAEFSSAINRDGTDATNRRCVRAAGMFELDGWSSANP